MLALQRAAGNRAVRQLLVRRAPAPTGGDTVIRRELSLASTMGETFGWREDATGLQTEYAALVTAIQRAVALIDGDVDEHMTEPLVELDRWVSHLAARKQIPWAERKPLRATIAEKLVEVDTAHKDITRVVGEARAKRGREAYGQALLATGGRRAGAELDTVAAHQRVSGLAPEVADVLKAPWRKKLIEAFAESLQDTAGARAGAELGAVGAKQRVSGMGADTRAAIGAAATATADTRNAYAATTAAKTAVTSELAGLTSSKPVTSADTAAVAKGVGAKAALGPLAHPVEDIASVRAEEAAAAKREEERKAEEARVEAARVEAEEAKERTRVANEAFADKLGERGRADLPAIAGATAVTGFTAQGEIGAALGPQHERQEKEAAHAKAMQAHAKAVQALTGRVAALRKAAESMWPPPNQSYLLGQLKQLEAMPEATQIASMTDVDVDSGVAAIEFDLGQARDFRRRLRAAAATATDDIARSPAFGAYFTPLAKGFSALSWADRQESLTNPDIVGGVSHLEGVAAEGRRVLDALAVVKGAQGSLPVAIAESYLREQVTAHESLGWLAQVAAMPALQARYTEITTFTGRMNAVKAGIDTIDGQPAEVKGRQAFVRSAVALNEKFTWPQQVAGMASINETNGLVFLEARLVIYSKALRDQAAAAAASALALAQQQADAAALAEANAEAAASLSADGDAIETKTLAQLTGDGEQEAVTAALAGIDGAGKTDWVKTRGGKWGELHRNRDGYLPGIRNNGGYKEYYVKKDPAHSGYGRRRLVTRNGKSFVYYTWTHYGDNGDPPFVRIR